MLDDILKKADALVHGDRNESYGHPYDDYKRVSDIYNAITGHHLDPEDCAMVMIAVKLARIGKHHDTNTIHVDSIIDLAGYAWVYAQILDICSREPV
jgi:hypothetical protein